MKTFKIAVNKSHKPFNLSEKALKLLKQEEPSVSVATWFFDIHYRTHPALIKVVETLGSEASGNDARIVIETHYGRSFNISLDPFTKEEHVITPNIQWIQAWPQS